MMHRRKKGAALYPVGKALSKFYKKTLSQFFQL